MNDDIAILEKEIDEVQMKIWDIEKRIEHEEHSINYYRRIKSEIESKIKELKREAS